LDVASGLTLALIAVLVLHLLEEIKTGFRRRLPIGKMPLSVFVGINILVYLFCAFTMYLSVSGSSLAFSFQWIFAMTMVLNGLGHIGIMTIKRSYFPGGLTAFLLLAAALALLVVLILTPNTI
jgi:hypothetical protein